MGRHHSRSRSRSPRHKDRVERHRHGDKRHRDERSHRSSRHGERSRSPQRDGLSHRDHRRRSSDVSPDRHRHDRSASPPRKREARGEGRQREALGEVRMGGHYNEQRHNSPEAEQPLPPPPDIGKPGKRRSRFEEPAEPPQPDAVAAEPPWGTGGAPPAEEKEEDKEAEPDFGLSGALAAESNKVNGVVLLHQEPPEAAKPQHRWRLYQFKGGKPFQEPLPIHRLSCYLFGRERRVSDIPTDHPSCSKQHAVLQFRRTEKEQPDGMMASGVRPYIMDLGSVNGTFLNGERLEAERYYELLEQDCIKFGSSSREYVLLHEGSSGM